jgi:hypothetical protein
MRALAGHRSWAAARDKEPPSGRLAPPDSWAGDDQATLVHIVGAAETFALERMQDAVADTRTRTDRDEVFLEILNQGRTWKGLRSMWRKHLSVDLDSYPRNAALEGFVEARNAILHAAGRLTPLQRRTAQEAKQTLAKLKAADVDVQSGAVVIGPVQVEDAALLVGGFIGWLDREVQ